MYAIGLMSGTSLDGLDASLIESDGFRLNKIVQNYHLSYTLKFQNKLKNLIESYVDLSKDISSKSDLVKFANIRLSEIENEFNKYSLQAVQSLLRQAGFSHREVALVGTVGQTLIHMPEFAYSKQIGDGNYLAKLSGIDVVTNFRTRDIESGGQGAPIIPIFHHALCFNSEKPTAIVNIGGVGCISYINQVETDIIAFDTGPGNAIINDLALKYYDKLYDKDGKIALSSHLITEISDYILNDKFFAQSYPKSLDRNYFHHYIKKFEHLAPNEQIAGFTYFTATSIIKALDLLPKMPKTIYLTGGGSDNTALVQMIMTLLPVNVELRFIGELGIDKNFVESAAMAFLAIRSYKGLSITFPNTTGAKKAFEGELCKN